MARAGARQMSSARPVAGKSANIAIAVRTPARQPRAPRRGL
jgi:hypothetical protein